MTSPNSNPASRMLSAAQVASLAAARSLAVALTLAAYWSGGATAGFVLGLLLVLTVMAIAATCVWHADDPLQRAHSHPDLPADHRHLRNVPVSGTGFAHRQNYHIDSLHPACAGPTV